VLAWHDLPQQTKSRLQKELAEKHNDLLRKHEEILQLRSRSQIIDRSAADVRSATNSAIKAHKKAAANELAGANSAVAAMEVRTDKHAYVPCTSALCQHAHAVPSCIPSNITRLRMFLRYNKRMALALLSPFGAVRAGG